MLFDAAAARERKRKKRERKEEKEAREKEFAGLMMFLCADRVYTFITAEGSYRDNGEKHIGY